jgi:type IX secretion system PorP/SprF family membrane protein
MLFYCQAQENSIFQNYYLTPFIINPAETGVEDYTVADFAAKRQWIGFPDAPTTYLISGNFRFGKYDFYDPKGFLNKGPLKLTDRIGIGAALYSDENGPSSVFGVLLSYAYHIPVDFESLFSFGISFTGTYYTFNGSVLNPDQPNDSYLLNGNDDVFRLNSNLGFYFNNYIYFIGLSANKILPDITQVNSELIEKPSFFLMGGYKFMFKNNSCNLEPVIVVKKIRDHNLSVDLHLKLYLKELNWISVSYSSEKRMNLHFGLRLYKMLYAGYNYEYSLGNIARFNLGSHEIHLGINLGLTGIKGIRETVNINLKRNNYI